MRLRLVILSTVLIAGAPAHAHSRANATRFTWEATPCAAACAPWVGNGFSPCASPFPPGGYADVITSPAPPLPAGKNVWVLEVTLDQFGRWEPYICDAETRAELANGTHAIDEPCQFWGGPMPPLDQLDCHLDMSTPAAPGRTYVLRAYNFASAEPAIGRYWYLAI